MYYYYPSFRDEKTKAQSSGRSYPESAHLTPYYRNSLLHQTSTILVRKMRQLWSDMCEVPLVRRWLTAYLTGEHGTEVIAAGSQHNPMGREVFLFHSQCHITERIALPEGVHRIKDGFSMSICHYVFGGHNAAHQAIWRENERDPWILQVQEREKKITMSIFEGLEKLNIFS